LVSDGKVCPVCGKDSTDYGFMIAVDKPAYINFYLHKECFYSENMLDKIKEFFKGVA